ncbi:MAG: hypothetical protein IPP40_09950 [bacterium]|nr:hypothetical protein [bacterium]
MLEHLIRFEANVSKVGEFVTAKINAGEPIGSPAMLTRWSLRLLQQSTFLFGGPGGGVGGGRGGGGARGGGGGGGGGAGKGRAI